jgi:hypothetical protein
MDMDYLDRRWRRRIIIKNDWEARHFQNCYEVNVHVTRTLDFLTLCFLCFLGEKPFTCDVCNKAFAHASDVSRHKIIHSGMIKWLFFFLFRHALFTENLSLCPESAFVFPECLG